ncbi:MAG: RHS repeat-associated core domain-containing protein [Mangrovibacterium sp.]
MNPTITPQNFNFEPFLFNGKELDEETGLYYYGARYYNPRVGLWYGVDPLREKYPSMSPYNYCANNPVIFVDPDGRIVRPAPGSSPEFISKYNAASNMLISKDVGGAFKQLVNSSEIYHIRESGDSFYSTADKTINWNVSAALEVDGKIVLSPTGVLGHEIEHAKNHDDAIRAWYSGDQDSFYEWYAGAAKGTSDKYRIREEENVITGPEQRIAKALGTIGENETTRESYIGQPVRVDGINSTSKTQAIPSIESKIANLQSNIKPLNLDLR